MIAFFITLIVFIYLISLCSSSFKEISNALKNDTQSTSSGSSMDQLVHQREMIKELRYKQEKKLSLNNRIREFVEKSKTYQEAGVYQNVLDLPDNTDEEFEYKEWLFNYGNLRTDQEIADWKYQHGGFEEDLKKPKWYILVWVLLCFLIPFVWLLSGYGFEYLMWDEVWFAFFMLLVFTSFIPILIYSCSTTSKLKKARKHGVSPRDPKFIDASVKAGIAAGGAASTFHASSKGIKNLTK
jgi:hypothetical protein